jgi:hypothetical protein
MPSHDYRYRVAYVGRPGEMPRLFIVPEGRWKGEKWQRDGQAFEVASEAALDAAWRLRPEHARLFD